MYLYFFFPFSHASSLSTKYVAQLSDCTSYLVKFSVPPSVLPASDSHTIIEREDSKYYCK